LTVCHWSKYPRVEFQVFKNWSCLCNWYNLPKRKFCVSTVQKLNHPQIFLSLKAAALVTIVQKRSFWDVKISEAKKFWF